MSIEEYTLKQLDKICYRAGITNNLDDCWEWLHGRLPKGYGKIRVNGRDWLAHRLIWTITRGQIPQGMEILHKCDNPSCCNPNHLFLGTQQDNVNDMFAKGRENIVRHDDEHNPNCKLTNAQIVEIRRKYRPGKKRGGGTPKQLAAEYGVSPQQIRRIAKHLQRA